MSELSRLLRYLVQGDKEAKISAVEVHGDPEKFTSQLANEYPRKAVSVYNDSDAASGEVRYGFTSDMTISGESHPVPRGSMISIPVSTDIDLYFMNTVSGEWGNIRVQEVA